MAHTAFISYSSKDKSAAEILCSTLEGKGISCWMAPRNIAYGADYGEAIVDAIGHSKVLVLLFSANANASPHIKREVDRAVSKSITIIPVRIENIAPTKALEYYISPVHWLDAMTMPLEPHFSALADKIQTILSTPAGEGESVSITPPAGAAAASATSAARPAPAPAPRKLGPMALIGGGVGVAALAIVLWLQPWSAGSRTPPVNDEQLVRKQDMEQLNKAITALREDQQRQQQDMARREEEKRLAVAKQAEDTKRAEETRRLEDARRVQEAKRLEEARRLEQTRRTQLQPSPVPDNTTGAKLPPAVAARRDAAALKGLRDTAALKDLIEQKLRTKGLLKQSSADRWGVTVDIEPSGIVTLTGVLHTGQERGESVRLAGEVPGVTEVRQKINVPESWK